MSTSIQRWDCGVNEFFILRNALAQVNKFSLQFILLLCLPGHRWNCSQVWKKDVFSHVVIVGECFVCLCVCIPLALRRIFISSASAYFFIKNVYLFNINSCEHQSQPNTRLRISFFFSFVFFFQKEPKLLVEDKNRNIVFVTKMTPKWRRKRN